MLHACVFVGVPEHVPPKASVTNLVRFFVWVPPPHGLVQADHDFQDSHVQSTGKYDKQSNQRFQKITQICI